MAWLLFSVPSDVRGDGMQDDVGRLEARKKESSGGSWLAPSPSAAGLVADKPLRSIVINEALLSD